jgi:hypothetical protein
MNRADPRTNKFEYWLASGWHPAPVRARSHYGLGQDGLRYPEFAPVVRALKKSGDFIDFEIPQATMRSRLRMACKYRGYQVRMIHMDDQKRVWRITRIKDF